MAEADEHRLARLVEAVLESPKYRHVSRDLVRRIGAMELGKGRGLKEGIKATRNKLHQVGGAYFEGRARYDDWLADEPNDEPRPCSLCGLPRDPDEEQRDGMHMACYDELDQAASDAALYGTGVIDAMRLLK